MTFDIEDFFGSKGNQLYDQNIPHAFIQWKGTDVCMDFYCTCGEEGGGHFDGDFAYTVQCPACGRKWEMAWYVLARESTDASNPWHHDSAKMLEAD